MPKFLLVIDTDRDLMKRKRILTYQELELLVLLADNRGHPSWELEYRGLSGRKHATTTKKLSQKKIRYYYNTVCMIDTAIKQGKLERTEKKLMPDYLRLGSERRLIRGSYLAL